MYLRFCCRPVALCPAKGTIYLYLKYACYLVCMNIAPKFYLLCLVNFSRGANMKVPNYGH